MAYFSKEVYFRKREWAARKQQEQRVVTALTEKQQDALAELCSIRHELHCNQEGFFYNENPEFKWIWEALPNWSDGGQINESLAGAGLPIITWSHTIWDFPVDSAWEAGSDEWDDAFFTAMEMAEDINSDIENYLRNIDDQYGTEYAPSRATRVVY